MAIPYFLVVTLSNHGSLLNYLGKITTIDFWLHGNYHGMWYIAVSLALYIITPPIYHWLTMRNKLLWFKVLFVLFIVFSINALLAFYNPEYWSLVEIGLSKVPCFYIGILFACLSMSIKTSRSFYVALVVLSIMYVINRIWNVVPNDYSSPLIGIPCFVLLFSLVFTLTDSFSLLRWINNVFKWFGNYTFELYLLHIFLWFIIKEVLQLNVLENIVLAVLMAIVLAIPMQWTTNKISSWVQGTIHKSNF